MISKYKEHYRLSSDEIRDRSYIKSSRLNKPNSLQQVRRMVSERNDLVNLGSPLAYELLKLDLYEQQEHGCGRMTGRCHIYVGGVCPNCPNSVTSDPLSFKCRSEQERLARLESKAVHMQRSVHDDEYLAEHVPPEAHGLMHAYRTNQNITRTVVKYLAEYGLVKDFLIREYGLADVPAHLAQQFIQRKISEILKEKEDEKNT